MQVHACFDLFFSKPERAKRRAERDFFHRLLQIPSDHWKVRLSECGPFFSTFLNDDGIIIENLFYGALQTGKKIYCIMVSRNSKYIYRGIFPDDLILDMTAPKQAIVRRCSYANRIYCLLCRVYRQKISELEKAGRIEQRNAVVEEVYETYVKPRIESGYYE